MNKTERMSHFCQTSAQGASAGKTLVLGLEHFIDKIGYQAAEYGRRGIDVLYLVLDKSGLSRQKAREYGARVEIVPEPLGERLRFTIRQFRAERPRFCELYDIGRLTLAYAMIAKLFGAKLILILRGAELWNTTGTPFRRWGVRATLRLANRIVAKELNIIDDLNKLAIPQSKVTFIGNCVPYPAEESATVAERDIDILFLNSVKRWRNVDQLVRALPPLLRRFPSLRVTIAGFTHLDAATSYRIDEEAENDVLSLIDKLGLRHRIEIAGFVPDAAAYYRRAKVFVLPADIIFANYSLLEAMSHGMVPLVGNGEGAGRIVRHQENGLIVERTADAITDGLIRLLEDPETMQRYAAAARQTIAEDFSMESWGERMCEVRSTFS